ncbi:MAG TPA: SDR family NAD(P)-dependent oxidoreductase [Ignavibacteriaceae bacterium]|nr:SDR family NAD(P)-dependent oxidoreductase [Ignavibacteriaceae bacterium]
MILKDKVILITGASSGIGKELTKLFVKEKCKVAILSRTTSKLINFERSLQTNYADVKAFQCDVTNHPSIRTTLRNVITHFGPIDIAVLNAGVSFVTNPESFNSELAEETIDTNLLGIVYFFEELLTDFKVKKDGIFVGISSLADIRGFPYSGFYCASKAAVTLFLESQRIELKKFNVKVITVKPGFVRTPMTDKNKFTMPYIMDADKAAKIIFKGIKKRKNIIQFPWQTVLGAKIIKLLPNSVFDFLAYRTKNN